MIKIKREIEIDIMQDKDKYFVFDRTTLGMLMGSESCSSNLHIYGIEKIKYKSRPAWSVPKTAVLERIEIYKNRIQTMNKQLDLMKAIVGGKK